MAWHPDRAAALAAPLSELAAHWIGLECSCNRIVRYPCKLLARKIGDGVALEDLVRRLRCEHCKAAPARVYLTDDPTGGVQGKVAWHIEIVP